MKVYFKNENMKKYKYVSGLYTVSLHNTTGKLPNTKNELSGLKLNNQRFRHIFICPKKNLNYSLNMPKLHHSVILYSHIFNHITPRVRIRNTKNIVLKNFSTLQTHNPSRRLNLPAPASALCELVRKKCRPNKNKRVR